MKKYLSDKILHVMHLFTLLIAMIKAFHVEGFYCGYTYFCKYVITIKTFLKNQNEEEGKVTKLKFLLISKNYLIAVGHLVWKPVIEGLKFS